MRNMVFLREKKGFLELIINKNVYTSDFDTISIIFCLKLIQNKLNCFGFPAWSGAA